MTDNQTWRIAAAGGEPENIVDHQHQIVTELVKLHGRRVLNVAFRVLGNPDLAADVQQEVFLRLLRRLPANVDSWPAYLTTVTTRLAIDELRRARRAKLVSIDHAKHVAAPNLSAADAERITQLRAALGRLSRKQAQCFAMRYFESMERTDIAKAMKISENNVSVTLNLAVNKLKQLVSHS